MVTDAIVSSSEIVMIAMANVSASDNTCMSLIIMKWDMGYVVVVLVENSVVGDGK